MNSHLHTVYRQRTQRVIVFLFLSSVTLGCIKNTPSSRLTEGSLTSRVTFTPNTAERKFIDDMINEFDASPCESHHVVYENKFYNRLIQANNKPLHLEQFTSAVTPFHLTELYIVGRQGEPWLQAWPMDSNSPSRSPKWRVYMQPKSPEGLKAIVNILAKNRHLDHFKFLQWSDHLPDSHFMRRDFLAVVLQGHKEDIRSLMARLSEAWKNHIFPTERLFFFEPIPGMRLIRWEDDPPSGGIQRPEDGLSQTQKVVRRITEMIAFETKKFGKSGRALPPAEREKLVTKIFDRIQRELYAPL